MTEIIHDMPFSEYLKLDRVSCSALKNLMECPAYYKWRKTNPMKESKAMKLGTFIHTWMLENDDFQKTYYAFPEIEAPKKPVKPNGLDLRKEKGSDRAIAYKEKVEVYAIAKVEHDDLMESYQEAAGDRIIVPEEWMKRFTKLPVRQDTTNEVTVLFEIDGVPCKSRFDMLHENGVEDLKTIGDIFKIDRDFAKFKYYLQAGFYSIAYKEAFGVWPDFFKFTFVNTGEFPAMVTHDTEFPYVEYGRMKAIELVKQLKNCQERDYWPSLPNDEIRMPSWM